jgi:hypothetical protein
MFAVGARFRTSTIAFRFKAEAAVLQWIQRGNNVLHRHNHLSLCEAARGARGWASGCTDERDVDSRCQDHTTQQGHAPSNNLAIEVNAKARETLVSVRGEGSNRSTVGLPLGPRL